jgi:hypothetical protein
MILLKAFSDRITTEQAFDNNEYISAWDIYLDLEEAGWEVEWFHYPTFSKDKYYTIQMLRLKRFYGDG